MTKCYDKNGHLIEEGTYLLNDRYDTASVEETGIIRLNVNDIDKLTDEEAKSLVDDLRVTLPEGSIEILGLFAKKTNSLTSAQKAITFDENEYKQIFDESEINFESLKKYLDSMSLTISLTDTSKQSSKFHLWDYYKLKTNKKEERFTAEFHFSEFTEKYVLNRKNFL